jgi:hypothetical protein
MRVLERLSVRLSLAILSGLSVAFALDWRDGSWLLEYGAPGALFGAGVLWPQLRPGSLLATRAVGLLAAGAASYWAAVGTALEVAPRLGLHDGAEPGVASFVAASFVGCAIVVVPAKWLFPTPTVAQYWLLATAAALVGGFVMYFGLVGPLQGDVPSYAAFATWHALLCVALHFGSRASARSSAPR